MQTFMLIDRCHFVYISAMVTICFVKMGKSYYSLVCLEERKYIKRRKDNIEVRNLNAEITSSNNHNDFSKDDSDDYSRKFCIEGYKA